MMELADELRLEHSAWCRDFIEHECILRCPKDKKLLIGTDGSLNSWQFYMQVALLNQEFCQRFGLLFWGHYGAGFEEHPFQICGCESGAVPLVTALQAAAYDQGSTNVNVFGVKKARKTFGLLNWFEGMVNDLPVMVVDDIIGSGRTLANGALRVVEAGLKLHPEAFAIVRCKGIARRTFTVGDVTYPISTTYIPNDFNVLQGAYTAKYGRAPVYHGIIV